jgi:CRISPR/Cas system CSM-associated protein Csm3 (group 7 of RAMP superfamily)
MARVTVDIPLTIEVGGPLHIGAGHGRGLLNRTVVKTQTGQVYIPGSSLRGVLRDAAEQLARALELKVCGAPAPDNMCGKQGALCLVCRLFGSPGRESHLIVDDALLRGDLQGALRSKKGEAYVPFGQTTQRTQVQLSRLRGLAREGRLFSSEFATTGLIFETTIGGILDLTPIAPDQSEDIEGQYLELILLLSAIKMVRHLGGGRRRGAGACRLILPEQIMARRHGGLSTHVATNDLLALVEWLEVYDASVDN